MPDLTPFQYDLVYNMFSFTFAAMFASLLFFILARGQVKREYRLALAMSALVVAVAGYHYFRIFESWSSAYILEEGMYVFSGVPFNDAYRYVDWLLTVPLLVAELIAVLGLPKQQRGRLTFGLATAAALMVALGYPGEVAADNATRFWWGVASTIPFLYIIYVLFTGLREAQENQPGEAKVLVRNTRWLLLLTWGVYPIVYMFPFFGWSGPAVLVGIQVGYAIADVAAKCGYGLMIYGIARARTEAEGGVEGEGRLTAAPAGD